MTDPVVVLSLDDTHWKDAFPELNARLEAAAVAAFHAGKKPAFVARQLFEISLVLTNDKTIKRLNNDYRHKAKPTNVLSFPQIEIKKLKSRDLPKLPKGTAHLLGDVFLSYGVVTKEAEEQGKTLESHAVHLTVHGVLHLLGYDHMTTREANIMEKLECDILDKLGYPDPYSMPYLRLVTD